MFALQKFIRYVPSQFQLAKAFHIESHVMSPAETKKLYPLMNVEGLYGSVYSPSDGTIDPAGYCSALARGAKQRGGKVSVVKFSVSQSGADSAVKLNETFRISDHQVICACLKGWSPRVLSPERELSPTSGNLTFCT